MGILTFLDVLLGLFFVYLVFAMIASAVNEAVAAIASSRAKWLRVGLRRVLGDVELDRVLKSPHLMFLAVDQKASTKPKGYDPSYVRAPDLLRALLGNSADSKDAADLWDMTSIGNRVAKLDPASPIRVVLGDLAREAKGSAEAFGKAFERWHADFEETVRSWYRQRTHYVLMGISLLLAVAFNVDTIRIIQHLSTDAETREQLAVLAIQATSGEEAGELAAHTAVREAREALAQVRKETPDDVQAILAAEDRIADELSRLRIEALQQVEVIHATGLPLGWNPAAFTRAETGSCCFWFDWLLAVLLGLPGLLISAFAFTLGAPFWFDLLKQIASMRSVGRAPSEVTRTETGRPVERSD